ncbi:hypothetical protein JCM18750_40630 [Halostagnicola bangensis]
MITNSNFRVTYEPPSDANGCTGLGGTGLDGTGLGGTDSDSTGFGGTGLDGTGLNIPITPVTK